MKILRQLRVSFLSKMS